MRFFVFLLALIQVFEVVASSDFHTLVREFLKSNTDVMRSRVTATLSQYDFELAKGAFDWDFSLSSSYDNDSQESAPFFNVNPLKTVNHSASLTRDFNWGGQFSFDNSLTTLRGSNPFGGLQGRIRSFTQGVTYTQDLGANFLGRTDRIQIDNALLSFKFEELQAEETIELSLQSFSNNYVEAKLRQTLVSLQEQALRRSSKRRKLIESRVRDGLREKVDLFQAQLTEMNQKEEVQNAELLLQTSLENLSRQLHRAVNKQEVHPFDLLRAENVPLPKGSWKENKNIKKLEQQISLLKGNLKETDYAYMPTISLSASYETNDFDEDFKTSIQGGRLGRDNDAVGVALNVTWPLGFGPQKINQARANLNLSLSQNEKKKIRANFDQVEISLKKRLEITSKSLESVQARLKLANKSLEEYNRLYESGRADLDQVIRAEEDLIGTQRNFVQYLFQRESLVIALAQIYGRLENYLLEER